MVQVQRPPEHRNDSLYGYIPTESVCIIFVVLFSISTLIHVFQATRYRLWWLFPTAVLAGTGEVIGWIGRLWSSQSPGSLDPFLMQICATIIAPTPLVAASFVILGRIIQRLGSEYSRLSPLWYTIVFCSADIVALVVQAIGGASASQAVETGKNPANGGHIMLGGIAFQLAAIVVYVALATEFFLRFIHDKPISGQAVSDPEGLKHRNGVDMKLKLMIYGLIFSTTCIFIRSVYRTIELSDGWTGRIIHTEVYFNVLDGAMITLAIFTLNFFHPGFLIPEATGQPNSPRRDSSDDSSQPEEKA